MIVGLTDWQEMMPEACRAQEVATEGPELEAKEHRSNVVWGVEAVETTQSLELETPGKDSSMKANEI